MTPPLRPVCSFERLDPNDISSAVPTSGAGLARQSVFIQPLGLGYERFLRWSLDEIGAAAGAGSEEQVHLSANALINARRSLSCLVDQYLVRDGFSSCGDAPRDAGKKAALLVRRGIFDPLAADVLKRAVDRRDTIEHRYQGVPLSDAQDTVHAIRSTIEGCVTKSDPYRAPAFFGSFLGGHSGGTGGVTHWFDGWNGLLFVIARSDSPPWFGIVVPSSPTKAVVRGVSLSRLTCSQLLDALTTLESRAGTGGSGCSENIFLGQLTHLGLR